MAHQRPARLVIGHRCSRAPVIGCCDCESQRNAAVSVIPDVVGWHVLGVAEVGVASITKCPAILRNATTIRDDRKWRSVVIGLGNCEPG